LCAPYAFYNFLVLIKIISLTLFKLLLMKFEQYEPGKK
jgi:hypothetical protein